MSAKRTTLVVSAITAVVVSYGCDRFGYNYIHFTERSREAQCRSQLPTLLASARSWDGGAEVPIAALGLSDNSRYNFFIGPRVLPDAGGTTDFLPASELAPPRHLWTGPFPLPSGSTPGRADAGLVVACAGDVDLDPGVDIWSIADFPRTVGVEVVPAYVLLHEVDDCVRYRPLPLRFTSQFPVDEVVLTTVP